VVADGEGRGVEEAEAGAATHRRVQVGHQREQHGGHARDEARRADQLGKFGAQMRHHVLRVGGLEGTVVRGLEEDKNGHELTGVQLTCPSPLVLARGEPFLLPQRLEADPKFVDRADEFE
jgi:hypothetical protein